MAHITEQKSSIQSLSVLDSLEDTLKDIQIDFVLFLFGFLRQSLTISTGRPRICNTPSLASCVVGLQAGATMPNLVSFFLFAYSISCLENDVKQLLVINIIKYGNRINKDYREEKRSKIKDVWRRAIKIWICKPYETKYIL